MAAEKAAREKRSKSAERRRKKRATDSKKAYEKARAGKITAKPPGV
jgi:hypothetical protein